MQLPVENRGSQALSLPSKSRPELVDVARLIGRCSIDGSERAMGGSIVGVPSV